MQVLQPELHLDQFFVTVGKAQRRVLLLDYDGTLVPFHVQRDQARPYPGVSEILRQLINRQ